MSNIKEKLERLLAYEAKTQNEISAELKDRVTAKRVANLKAANDEYDKAAAKSGMAFGEPETDKALDKSYAAWKKLERNRLLNLKDWRQKLNGDEFVTLKDGREGTLGGLVYDNDNNFIGYEFSTNPYGGYEYEKIQPEDIAKINEAKEGSLKTGSLYGVAYKDLGGNLFIVKASSKDDAFTIFDLLNDVINPKEEDTLSYEEVEDHNDNIWNEIDSLAKGFVTDATGLEVINASNPIEDVYESFDADNKFAKLAKKHRAEVGKLKASLLAKYPELAKGVNNVPKEELDAYLAKEKALMDKRNKAWTKISNAAYKAKYAKNEISDETVYRAAAKSHDRVMKSMANDSEFDKNLDKYNSLMNMGLRREWKKAGLKDPGEMSAKQLGKVWDKDYTPVVDKFHKNVTCNTAIRKELGKLCNSFANFP